MGLNRFIWISGRLDDRAAQTQEGDYKADRMHIVLLAEQIWELGDTGSMVYD